MTAILRQAARHPPHDPEGAGISVDRGYSRFVGAMRLLLPIVAGSLVAVVIAWPQFQGDQGERIPFLQGGHVDLKDRVGQRLTKARFTGVDSGNQPYMITADTVEQTSQESDLVDLTNPQADIALESGAWLSLAAREGMYARGKSLLTLSGGVDLFHNEGYELHTRHATVDLKQGTASGDSDVAGHGPFGELEAEGFRILREGATVVFTGKTRLLLYPDAGTGAQ